MGRPHPREDCSNNPGGVDQGSGCRFGKKVIGFWILKVGQQGLLVDLTCVCVCLLGGVAGGV